MRPVWENSYQKLIQAVYTEDKPFVRQYGPSVPQGIQNSLKMALDKVGSFSKVYRIEDEFGVIIGFAILDHKAGVVQETHIRPSQKFRALDFYATVDELLKTGNNYKSYIINDCALNSCAFIQATTTCNFLPLEFRVFNGVLQYKYTWSQNWIPILEIPNPVPIQPKKVVFRKFGNWIQWSYEGEDSWTNLYDISEFTGEEMDSVRLTVGSTGQTIFPIPEIINDKKNTLLFVNGQKKYWPEDYSINNVNLTLQWLDDSYQLKPHFEIDLYYKKP